MTRVTMAGTSGAEAGHACAEGEVTQPMAASEVDLCAPEFTAAMPPTHGQQRSTRSIIAMKESRGSVCNPCSDVYGCRIATTATRCSSTRGDVSASEPRTCRPLHCAETFAKRSFWTPFASSAATCAVATIQVDWRQGLTGRRHYRADASGRTEGGTRS